MMRMVMVIIILMVNIIRRIPRMSIIRFALHLQTITRTFLVSIWGN